ncbi:MAG TPA: zinc ribbon domain-containing protein [Thermoanaerobaculia bacterium]|jgi:putative FmdB family regulatory protein|nr:zinc ribbon domain-containing protein [Thermoanaerobaculia bacterium]
MPIYEYQCLSCGKKTEVLQRMDDAPLAACPTCGGEVKKLISAPSFQLKGSGWYATDYGGKKGGGGSSSSESKPEKSESKGEGKAEGKSESKPEKAAVGESKGSGGSGSGGGGSE